MVRKLPISISSIETIMKLCDKMDTIEFLEHILSGEYVEGKLTEKFNPEIGFGNQELISLLYYLGYLTIKDNELDSLKFGIPNDIIKKIYSNYFLEYIKRKADFSEKFETLKMSKEILLEGKIDIVINIEQLNIYKNSANIKVIPNLKCYSVIAIKDDLFIEEV